MQLPKIKLPKFIKDLLTGPDGQTYDVVRVAFAGAVLAFLGLAGADVLIHHLPFNPIAYGTGFGALSGGSGAAIAVKQMAGAEPAAADPTAAPSAPDNP